MSRRTILTAVAGLVLIGGIAAPAAADPLLAEDTRETVCVRTDGGEGTRKGICVWVPLPR